MGNLIPTKGYLFWFWIEHLINYLRSNLRHLGKWNHLMALSLPGLVGDAVCWLRPYLVLLARTPTDDLSLEPVILCIMVTGSKGEHPERKPIRSFPEPFRTNLPEVMQCHFCLTLFIEGTQSPAGFQGRKTDPPPRP